MNVRPEGTSKAISCNQEVALEALAGGRAATVQVVSTRTAENEQVMEKVLI